MRFILSATCVALKRSVSVILCVGICLAAVAAAFSVAMPLAKAEPIKIAIVNQDDSAMMLPIVTTMLESRLGGMLKTELCDTEQQAEHYAAVLVLPNGFFNSVMSGENLAPKLTVNASSPFEGLWISSLAKSAAKLITQAQNVVGAVNAAAKEAELSVSERDKVIMSLNTYLLNDYLTRKGRFESVTLSATGEITAAQHYFSGAVSFLCFVMAFLLFAPIKELRDFAFFSNKRMHCMISAAINCMAVSMLITSAAVIILGDPDDILSSGFIKAAVLLFSVMLLFPSVTKAPASCAALCCGACLFQAVFGGFVLPEALLPPALQAVSRFLPMTLFRRVLADTAFGCGFGGDAILFAWCLLLISVSVLCWMRKEEAA